MAKMNLKRILFFLLIFQTTFCGMAWSQTLEPVTDLFKFCSEKRGFNLLGKFDVSNSNKGFSETEFKMIHDLGFNFVRIPLDFRTYTKAGDWNTFIETELVKIDKAVEWGTKYGVHVCINIHRAPGYCVNPTTLPVNQQLNLWTDIVAQDAFVKHWEMFANRYKTIGPDKLSFNLVNEPTNVTPATYIMVMKKGISAIHQITPERIVFVDGTDWGTTLIPALKDEPNVAQSIHCYDPSSVTHYKAEWVSGSNTWPVPVWPMLTISKYLYGTWKTEFKSALAFEDDFPAGTEITVNVGQVSLEATLTIKAGTTTLLNKRFVCTADLGTDFTSVLKTEWGYQNISNKDYTVTLTAAASKISFENSLGDWMTINSISIKRGTDVLKYTLSNDAWGKKQSTYLIDESGTIKALDGSDLLPFENYRKNVAIAKTNNIPFMVQEFGVYNKTPYEVTIGFLTDLSKFFSENNIGWALWNFNGSFGIINSGRTDCTYETFNGFYKLDRRMLNVLTKNWASTPSFQNSEESLVVYPSPAKDFINISSDKLKGNTSIEIIDMTGRLMKKIMVEANGYENIQLDVKGLTTNVYLLKAINNGKIYSAKLLIGK